MKLRRHLHNAFKMVDMGAAEFYVGVRIVRDCVKRILYLHQDAYLEKILEKYSLNKCIPTNTPMLPGQHLVPFQGTTSTAEIEL